ncbi:hypothetical protein P152DRAFT_6126 [Eremomyces bilateralis CBS 781.70]|uniref:LYR motif-containing protein 2 n=1 Tax=Eremomyces bilateralis CBS 781.70 TaxID=1392243 RepID=A0A6G1GGM2_9PEZI|nr:uncharacterized protein P152DRAFT_6126 [Eremomyces bilateralis CBS 781.70]KAF1817019.1 hypothetical protein P152DRAFT_6126 [Eremomyces bilateralis CBS 781.70]
MIRSCGRPRNVRSFHTSCSRFRSPIRQFASDATSRDTGGRKGVRLPTLDEWIQRERAISLWRDIVRAINEVPSKSTRQELREFARGEFERHRYVTDIGHIRYLISTGKTEFDHMKRYVEEQAR